MIKPTKVRKGQNIFSKAVLSAYDFQCAITQNPIPELLIASHILPWSEYPEHRLNPKNGICLSRNYDAASDQGLIAFDENYKLITSQYLERFLPSEIIERDFMQYKGQPLNLPRQKFSPNKEFLAIHRQKIFKGDS